MKHFFSLVKISHTIFALPFALMGLFLGLADSSEGWSWTLFLLVVGCMFFGRNAAMAFNRLVDAPFDAQNPRTSSREIPKGILSTKQVRWFVATNAIAFIVCTYFINTLCFLLSPVALMVILGYSYAKRFTVFAHFILGLGLALAPVGAYIAVTGYFTWIPILLGGVVLLWVAGFDMIYALQDEQVDRDLELYSIPAWIGVDRTINLSNWIHFICGGLLLLVGWLLTESYTALAYMTWIGIIVFISLLIYQHRVVNDRDLSRINLAFFTLNGTASLILGTLVLLDFWI